ncbi:MAG: hypothetical protein K9K82_07965 [Desulfobacteraceae bacterium]|nr:hypothetical protein [Desulfobacteraceae bacterium]
METEDNGLLLQVFSSVFEEFAFMFVEEDPFPEPSETSYCPCLLAEISFKSKDKHGFLEVVAPVSVCAELAENILGTDQQELPEQAEEQALTEVLNVSCGYFLAEKFGTEEVFDLSIPEIRPVSQKQWAALIEDGAHACMRVDESPLLVRFVLQQ